jgi:hypothetical protein
MMQAHLELTFRPMWPNVRKIRHEVGIALERCPAELRSAAMMTASELVENAIKYGDLQCMRAIARTLRNVFVNSARN